MFTLFLIAIAAFWAAIGVLLARWLKQAGYNKPFAFKGRNLGAQDLAQDQSGMRGMMGGY
jgi:hypothetical protein